MKYTTGYKHRLHGDVTFHVSIFPAKDIVTEFIDLTHLGELTVKDNWMWDGISGPTFQTKRTKSPSCMHDAIYWLIRNGHLPFSTWQVADHEFKRICLEKGIFKVRAWWLYRGLSLAHGIAALPSHKKKVLTAP